MAYGPEDLRLETMEEVIHHSSAAVVLVAEEWQELVDWRERGDEGGQESLVKIRRTSGGGHAWSNSLSSF